MNMDQMCAETSGHCLHLCYLSFMALHILPTTVSQVSQSAQGKIKGKSLGRNAGGGDRKRTWKH